MTHTLKIKLRWHWDDYLRYYYEKLPIAIMVNLPAAEGITFSLNKLESIDFGIECELVTYKDGCEQKEPFMLMANDELDDTPLIVNGPKVYPKGPHIPSISVRCINDSSYYFHHYSKCFQIVAFDGAPIEVKIVDDFDQEQ